uniref:Ketoreductase domain-containing protein n=1 Tax=Fusarium oxysporum (strain Fo5176) TaxID=660025 RepID=A0A0D2YHV3_FUSOF
MEDLKPFSGKVIIITGAARGIGLATARYLAARGATISLADVLEPELEKAQADISKDFPGTSVLHSVVDVRGKDAVESYIRNTKESFGRIDGCVNNAGISGTAKAVVELTNEEWQQALDINLTGVFNCLRAEIPTMEDYGSIVNISSTLGLHGAATLAPYVTSKHGVLGLTKCAAKEVASRETSGAVDTPMLREAIDKIKSMSLEPENLPQLFKRYSKPEEIAALIAYLLGDESKFTTSSVYSIDGGWSS